MDVKALALSLGADLCGIASVDRFADAPTGFSPTDILPGAKSVVVLALRWPEGTIRTTSQAVYTFARVHLASTVDAMAFRIAGVLESAGHIAAPLPSNEPYDYWDPSRRHGHGVLSFRHAAVHAGLGRLGRNTLLINERFGNPLWFGAVVTTAALEPDGLATYEVCIPDSMSHVAHRWLA